MTKTPEPPSEESRANLRQQAMTHYAAGRMHDAVQAQVAALNATTTLKGQGSPEEVDDLNRLGLFLFALGDYGAAVTALERARSLAPQNPEIVTNLGVVQTRNGQYEDATRTFLEARPLAPEDPNILDGLASACGHAGNIAEASRYGEESLAMKDRQAAATGAVSLPGEPPVAFDRSQPERNVIAFSLWGDAPRYLDAALRNVEEAARLYPAWRCRFYLDPTVPEATVEQLAADGADIVPMPRHRNFYEGLFWRFRVAEDDAIDRFLVRDCDAVVNPREQAAVEEWLASDRYFHVMRDDPSHTELILAGMWGGVGNILPIRKLIADFSGGGAGGAIVRTIDQIFLRRLVWPIVRQSVMTHDSLHRVLSARDFPAGTALPSGHHVGQNEAAIQNRALK